MKTVVLFWVAKFGIHHFPLSSSLTSQCAARRFEVVVFDFVPKSLLQGKKINGGNVLDPA